MTVFKTILFAMDGVVINSEKPHLRAMNLSLEKIQKDTNRIPTLNSWV